MPLLFDLVVNAGEQYNFPAEHPAVVAELTQLAERLRGSLEPRAPLFDVLLPAEAP